MTTLPKPSVIALALGLLFLPFCLYPGTRAFGPPSSYELIIAAAALFAGYTFARLTDPVSVVAPPRPIAPTDIESP